MKKLGKSLIMSIVITGTVFATISSQSFAATLNSDSLNNKYKEELYAKEMYSQMVGKFDNDSYYNRFVKAETQHADSVKRAMELNKIDVKTPSISVKVSDDELTALKDALKFEQDDVKSLDAKIAGTSDATEKAIYERLKDRSERHAKSLEYAISEYKKGNKDLAANLANNPNKAYGQNQGKKQGQNNTQALGQKNGQGQGLRDGSCGNCTNPKSCPLQDGSGRKANQANFGQGQKQGKSQGMYRQQNNL